MINSGLDTRNINGWTPLMIASETGLIDEVKKLINEGATLNLLIDTKHELMIASHWYGQNSIDKERTIKFLIKSGADLDLQDDCGTTSLMAACESIGIRRFENTAKILIDAGANLDLQDIDGFTALMYASRIYGIEKTAYWLIDAGADLELRDKNGYTALTHACILPDNASPEDIHQAKNIIRSLIYAGARISQTELESCFDRKYLEKCLSEKVSLDETKKIFSEQVIKNIKTEAAKFKLSYDKYGQKIVMYDFMISSGIENEEIYEKIKIGNPYLLDFLSIKSSGDLGNITKYIDF